MEDWGPGLAIILGIVEGLTEFLPVSSTGHLILVGHYLGFTGELAASIDIAIQLGSILAIVAYERAKLISFASGAARDQAGLRTLIRSGGQPGRRRSRKEWGDLLRRSLTEHQDLWFLIAILVAFVPAAIVGLLTHRWIKTYLFKPETVAGALILGGLVILAVESRRTEPRVHELKHVGLRSALAVGLAQCCALFPGVSRSGATIIGGMLGGMDRRVATEFSFFLALPTMLAATGYQIYNARDLLSAEDFLALGLGLLVAFFVGWAVIAGLLAFVKQHTLRLFGYYRIALGLIVLLVFV